MFCLLLFSRFEKQNKRINRNFLPSRVKIFSIYKNLKKYGKYSDKLTVKTVKYLNYYRLVAIMIKLGKRNLLN